MKTLHYSVLSILLALPFLVSCNEARKSIEETLHPKQQKKAPSGANSPASATTFSSSHTFSTGRQKDYKSIFESAATLDSIQQELRNIPPFKGKKLFFLGGFYFYDYQGGIISIDLQDPGNPENVDTYTYSNGEWNMQRPVKITGNFPLKSMLAPLDEVKFSTAKKVYDAGLEKSKTIEGAEPITQVYFNQIKEVHVKEWYLMIKGARHDYQVKFDVNGKFMGMR
jgi:hypothetical protein